MSDVDILAAPPVRVADWEAFTVPEGYRAEIIRGELVVTPGTDVDHGRAQNRLVTLLAGLVPAGYEPVLDYGTGPFPSDGLPVDLRPLPR